MTSPNGTEKKTRNNRESLKRSFFYLRIRDSRCSEVNWGCFMDVWVEFPVGVKKWEAGGGRWEKGGRFQKVSETFSADKNVQKYPNPFPNHPNDYPKIPENGSKKYPENSDKSVLNYRHLFLRGIPSQKVQNLGRWV